MIVSKSSKIFIGWHMIVREDYDNFVKVFDSLHGLYDELIVAVDDRPESDCIEKFLSGRDNVISFRQKWPGRFDYARQDALSRVSEKATYIGCCDSDEVLSSHSPLEVRKLISELKFPAFNVYIKYLSDVGPHETGQTYLRTKIWSAEYPRKWVGRVHEYPKCIGQYVDPVTCNIVFDHLKVDHKHYRSKLIIDTIWFEIKDRGITRWYPYLAQEYRGEGLYLEAINCCTQYLKLDKVEDEHLKTALDEALTIFSKTSNDQWQEFFSWISPLINSRLLNNPIICEYLAMCSYYKKYPELAKLFNQKAQSLADNSKTYQFIYRNSKFYD